MNGWFAAYSRRVLEGKKYPSNNSSRISVHENPYTMEINPKTCMSSQMMQTEHNCFQLAMGRSGGYMMNHAEIQEVNRVFRGSGSSSMSLPVLQSQMNYNLCGSSSSGGGGNCFTISGLNLNLGGDVTTSQPQVMNQQDVSSSDHQAGYGADMSSGNAMNRSMAMENCADLDNYWATY
ncbi:hypothetical protein K7X08_029109 [Anisodus acutangulus]|uniref:Uncharacterized protein n=1 Tax=Anisodus acutangulus TaxID=402998 RepID=A0A9Q1L1P8_9SOLA|nr:hypothetical protein K7X08_029109 [Anisodus acutangulus]